MLRCASCRKLDVRLACPGVVERQTAVSLPAPWCAGPAEAADALAEVIPDIVLGSMGESRFDQARLAAACMGSQ